MELWDRLTQPDTLTRDTWQWDEKTFRRRTYGEAIAEARHVAAGLRRLGVAPGSIIGAVITNGPDAISCVAGAWFAGVRVASLPIISRGMSIESYTAQLRRCCELLEAECLVAEDRFLTFMTDDTDVGVDVIGCRRLLETTDVADIAPPPVEETIFIQFSSGTTGEPRGVELTGKAIDAQLNALSAKVAIDPEQDVGYSWLPMSHDMGFFGCTFLGWYNGIPGVMGTPERFLANPRTWLDDCAEFGATVTAGPPFALDLAARVEQMRPNAKPLKLRLCLVGAEEVLWSTLENAINVFAARGMTPEVLTPAYGLAEATLAVTIEPLETSPAYVDVDTAALAEGRVEVVDPSDHAARRLVSAGESVDGMNVRIDSETGEIVVRGPSLASRYFADEQRTEERLGRGELRTGDVGFLYDGKLFICGRNDDLLTLQGRNVYVQEIERTLSADPEVRAGSCAIVDIRDSGQPRVALVAETRETEVDVNALATRLYRHTLDDSGLSIHDFVFLDRGMFPKTPSGKVQRYRCRELVAEPGIGRRVTLGTAS